MNGIEIYDERLLDCYQNLLISLLVHRGFHIEYLGAIWPCSFLVTTSYSKNKQHLYHFMNTECVTRDNIKRLYDINLIYEELHSAEILWSRVKSLIDEKTPVILGVDQYYVPHHYPYIYQHQHGLHSLIVTGYNEAENTICCIDAIPRYKGEMELQELLKGIKEKSNPWYAKLDFLNTAHNPKDEDVWIHFIGEIKKVKEQYYNKAVSQSGSILYTPFVLHIVESLEENMQTIEAYEVLMALCEGVWGWEVGRKSDWFAAYLNSSYVKAVFRRWELCLELENKIKKYWQLAFRFLFMATQQNDNKKLLNNAINKLRTVVVAEQQIINMILEEGAKNCE